MRFAVICLVLSLVLVCNGRPNDYDIKQTAIGKESASNVAIISDGGQPEPQGAGSPCCQDPCEKPAKPKKHKSKPKKIPC
ncbi:uncharacterized protein LOC113513777 [Galleria mellonella]|uniref:Uncharacterized protein LOC113513777 n=1 Tax=Galleria mellonella TaxID=7137 RepID=A0A385JC16_GALME|nr:uncharacterized protein LOC113513777 [Galleria mellonella]AXY94912.1 P-8 [Galleria mellonella]